MISCLDNSEIKENIELCKLTIQNIFEIMEQDNVPYLSNLNGMNIAIINTPYLIRCLGKGIGKFDIYKCSFTFTEQKDFDRTVFNLEHVPLKVVLEKDKYPKILKKIVAFNLFTFL